MFKDWSQSTYSEIDRTSAMPAKLFAKVSPNIDLLKSPQVIYYLAANIRILYVYVSLSSRHQYRQGNYGRDYKNIRKTYIPGGSCHLYRFKRPLKGMV